MSVANPHHVSNGHHTTGGISPNSLMNTSLGKEIRFHYKESGLLLSIHFYENNKLRVYYINIICNFYRFCLSIFYYFIQMSYC